MTRCRDQRGFVLVTAMVVLMIMLMLGLAMLATVNVQTRQTGNEKRGEAAFNVAESALDAEAYQLKVAWPAANLPVCPQTPPPSACQPIVNDLESNYTGAAYAGATWSVRVIDDTGGAGTYADSLATSPTAWDANDDGRVWVRAQATVGGQTRILVEQIVRQKTVLPLPDNSVTAGNVYTENDGNTPIIDALDQATGLTGFVEVRCSAPSGPIQGAGNCLGFADTAKKQQLSPPNAYSSGYPVSQTLSGATLDALIAEAQANNTYYDGTAATNNTCPPIDTPGIVVVTNMPQPCSYTGNGTATWNSAASPGILLFLNGSLELSGNLTFYGLVYRANPPGGPVPPCTDLSQPPVVTVHGNATVDGAVFADGCGVVALGESGTDVQFDSDALQKLQVTEAAMPAQNTFRIIPNA